LPFGLLQPSLTRSLQDFGGLGTVVKLSLGDGSRFSSPPIFIDSRAGDAKVLDSAPDGEEPGVTANIMPEHVLDVIEGRMHAQHAFGKRAKPPCQGFFPSCFAPGGRPGLVTDADQLGHEGLPEPTENLAQIKCDLRDWGYAFVKNALSPDQVRILRTAVEEQAAGERAAGVAHMDSAHSDQPNQRVWNLPNKGDEFLDLLNHPLVDAVMPWFLGNAFKIHSMSANIVHRTNTGIYMHRDQMGLTPETIDHAYLLNAIWYLVDVTEERGATRVYPGSHNQNVSPPNFTHKGGSIPATAPAGSVLLLDSRTWHSTGVNTEGSTRPVILQAFCRFFVQSMENYPSLLDEETKAKLSDRQLGLLGFPVPVREGQPPQAYTAYSRPGAEAGKLRAPDEA
ncbi:phytanoyl-CoA dioxygenase, partial [Diaporthe helianthi]